MEKDEVKCKDCQYLMFSDCYGECKKGYKGIVNPNDSCPYGVKKAILSSIYGKVGKSIHNYTLKELQNIPLITFETQEITEIVLVPVWKFEACKDFSIIKAIFCQYGKIIGASICGDLISLKQYPFSEVKTIDCLDKSNCLRLQFNPHEVHYGI